MPCAGNKSRDISNHPITLKETGLLKGVSGVIMTGVVNLHRMYISDLVLRSITIKDRGITHHADAGLLAIVLFQRNII